MVKSSLYPLLGSTYLHSPTVSKASGLLSKYIQNLTTSHLFFFFFFTTCDQAIINHHLSSILLKWLCNWSPYFCTCPHSVGSHTAARMILLKFQIDCVTFSSRNSPVAIHHIQFKNQLSYNRLQSPLTFSSVSSILFQPHWPSQCSSKSTRMRLLQNVCTCSLSLFSFFTTHLLHLFPHFSRSLIKSFLLCVPSVTIVWKNCIPLLSTTMLLLID